MSAGIESALLGDALASAVAVDHSQFDLQNSLVSVEQQNISDTSSVRQELIFVDAATPEYQQLVQQLIAGAGDGRDFDVIIIDSGSDGITQISQVLIGYDSLDAIHVISHGADGGVQLGNAWLDGGSLARYADLIAGWGDALDADADLLFYGCDLAAGTDGQDLIAELATLTGADIAASNDLTGHTELGGDWVLEYQSGAVESSIVADSVTQKAWRGVLSNISGTIFEDVDGNANLGDAVGVANVSMILYLDDGD
ncbi:MAG: DUF4347 domain-containing protein, partial [Gammaproteobacteria bacterium]|nr:DUF4347 domain-containing protein [Gammaproteobacteria bacterium]